MLQLKLLLFQPFHVPDSLLLETFENFYVLKENPEGMGYMCYLVPAKEQLSITVSSQNTEFPIFHQPAQHMWTQPKSNQVSPLCVIPCYHWPSCSLYSKLTLEKSLKGKGSQESVQNRKNNIHQLIRMPDACYKQSSQIDVCGFAGARRIPKLSAYSELPVHPFLCSVTRWHTSPLHRCLVPWLPDCLQRGERSWQVPMLHPLWQLHMQTASVSELDKGHWVHHRQWVEEAIHIGGGGEEKTGLNHSGGVKDHDDG